MTTIRYFIPEDGDEEDYPNIFLMPKQQAHTGFSPKLRDVKDAFPMPGVYHFRFKSPLIPGTDREKGAVAVWMDCVDDNQHVGVWRNTIVAKVTRINMDDEGEAEFMNATPSPMHANEHTPAPASVRQQAPVSSRPAPSQRASQPPAQAEGDILGVFEEPTPALGTTGSLLDQTQPTMTHSEGSLLDMTGGSYNDTPSGNGGSNHNDFMGMTATPEPVAAPVPAPIPAPTHSAPSSGSYGARPLSQQQHVPQKVQPPRSGNAAGLSLNNSGPFGGLNWD